MRLPGTTYEYKHRQVFAPNNTDIAAVRCLIIECFSCMIFLKIHFMAFVCGSIEE